MSLPRHLPKRRAVALRDYSKSRPNRFASAFRESRPSDEHQSCCGYADCCRILLPHWKKRTVMDRSQIVHSNPEILGGEPVFVGTRVPVRTLLVYLEGGETLEEFLDNFPTVSREQAIAFLEESASSLLAQIA